MFFAVCGLHLSGCPLNYQLTNVGGKLVRATKTIAKYTMHALSDAKTPLKPGLVFHPNGAPNAAAIAVEVWDIPDEGIGSLLKLVPPPLSFGSVWLENGERVYGFTAEGWAADPELAKVMGVESNDVTEYEGWRKFMMTVKDS